MQLHLADLNRRGVFKTLAAYAVAAWVLTEVMSVIAPAFLLPEWTVAALTTVLVLGAFPVILLSWRYDLTLEGIKRDTRELPPEVERSAKIISGIIALVLLAVTTTLWVNYFRARDTEVVETMIQAQQGAPEIEAGAQIESIAVLPFDDFSPGGGQQLLADGIAEAILHVLAQNRDLLVTARKSSFYFRDKDVTAAEIGTVLGVQALLEGSVQIVKDRLRVTSQLIRTADQSHIWSDVFEAPLDDLFEVQDAIAFKVRDLVLPRAEAALDAQGQPHPPSVEAFQLLLEARDLIGETESTERAIRMIGIIIQMWPDYADAHAWLAMALDEKYEDMKATRRHSQSDLYAVYEQMDAAADAALALNPNNHMAILIKGAWTATGTAEGYHAALRRVWEMAPNDPPVLEWLAGLWTYTHGFADAEELRRRAHAIDPSDHDIFMEFLMSTCGLEEQVPLVESHLENYPASRITSLGLRALALHCDGRRAEAAAAFIRTARFDTDPEAALFALLYLASLGHEPALELVGAAHRSMPRVFSDQPFGMFPEPAYFTGILENRLTTFRRHMKSTFARPSVTPIVYAGVLMLAGDDLGAARQLETARGNWDRFYASEGEKMWHDHTTPIYANLAWLLGRHGEGEEARKIARELYADLERKGNVRWSGSRGGARDLPLMILLLNDREDLALDWLRDAGRDRWLWFQPVLTSPVYEEFRQLPEVAEILAKLVDYRAGVLDQLVTEGIPEVLDPALLLDIMGSLLNPSYHDLAQVALHFDGDENAALGYFAGALAEEPDNLAIINQAAGLAMQLGLVEEAALLGERAVMLKPRDTIVLTDAAWNYMSARRFEDAIALLERSLEYEGRGAYARRLLVMSLVLNGDAERAMDVAREIPKGFHRGMALALAHHALGQRLEAQAVFDQWLAESGGRTPFHAAYLLAFMDQPDLAFEWLDKAATQGGGIELAAVNPMLRKLHDDPRWPPFLERIGKAPEQLAGIEFDLVLPD